MTLNEIIKRLEEIHEHNKANDINNTVAKDLEMLLPELKRELNSERYLLLKDIANSVTDNIVKSISVIEELDKLFEEYKGSDTEEEQERKLKRIIVINHTIFILAGLKVPKSY